MAESEKKKRGWALAEFAKSKKKKQNEVITISMSEALHLANKNSRCISKITQLVVRVVVLGLLSLSFSLNVAFLATRPHSPVVLYINFIISFISPTCVVGNFSITRCFACR